MFGSLGFPELIVIFLVALIVFGPKKLPDIGRSIGRALGEFKRASNDLKNTLEEEVRLDEMKSIAPPAYAATSPVSDYQPSNYALTGTGTPDLATLDLATSDPSTPELSTRDLSVPDLSETDFTAPDAAAPDISASDINTSDEGIPGSSVRGD